jgi:hypothetical protein
MLGPILLRLQSCMFQYGELATVFMSSTDILEDLFLIRLEHFFTRVFQTGIVFTVCYNILYTSILTNTMPY